MARTAAKKVVSAAEPKAAEAQQKTAETAPADNAKADNSPDARIGRLERSVKELHNLLHSHGIRHKATE